MEVANNHQTIINQNFRSTHTYQKTSTQSTTHHRITNHHTHTTSQSLPLHQRQPYHTTNRHRPPPYQPPPPPPQRLDLTRHRMIYDGTMTWRICRSKQLDVHAILLDDLLVLLQKSPDSDKLVLKCQSSSTTVSINSPQTGGPASGVVGGGSGGAKEDKHTHSPIVKLTNLLLRNVATGWLA